MRSIEEILITPYSKLAQDEHEQVLAMKNHKGSLTVYEYICKILGDNNPAEKEISAS